MTAGSTRRSTSRAVGDVHMNDVSIFDRWGPIHEDDDDDDDDYGGA